MTPTLQPSIKAITIRQPHASLMAVGAKQNETRSWYTSYRGPLAIHAGTHWTMMEQLQLRQRRFFDALADHYPLDDYGLPAVPIGAIVGVGMLVDCISTNDLSRVPSQATDEFWFGDYTPDRWMWRVENVQRLEIPIRCVGHQGLWVPEAHVMDRLQIFV